MGILFPCNDVEMKFRHNDVGISFPCFGVGTAIDENRKSFSQKNLKNIISEDNKICLAYNSEY